MSEVIKTIFMRPAFDKRDKDPSRDYGIHGVDIYFTYQVGDKAVRLTVFSNWYLKKNIRSDFDLAPMAAGCSFHYKSEDADAKDCDIFGKCSDGTMFNEPFNFYETLTERGSDGIFEELQKLFEEEHEE